MIELFTLNLIHLIITAYLTGLIWTIQVVHYPLFAHVPDHDFTTYEKKHVRLISFIVGPAMLLEAVLAISVLLVGDAVPTGYSIAGYLGLGCLVVIWLSTWFLQVPCHNLLGESFNLSAIKRLVITNWIRTLCWTMRTIIAATMLYLVR